MSESVPFIDHHPQPADFHAEALAGLASEPKRLSPKFFYDRRGSELFERITQLDEYYPTRTETAILEENAGEVGALFGDDCLLIEYGSGSSRKVRILLDEMRRRRAGYVAIDISKEHLLASVHALANEYPEIDISAVCADYTRPVPLPDEALQRYSRRIVFFPGSTIGNFTPPAAGRFLTAAAETVGPGGGLLVGVDRKKDRRTLDAAYNDAQGVTAEFNLNLLRRMNRELGAAFDLDSFRHRAFYNAEEGRVEMHLVSLANQSVRVNGTSVDFRAGETIHTESSYKYGVEEFQQLAAQAGFRSVREWSDSESLFSVHYLVAESLSE